MRIVTILVLAATLVSATALATTPAKKDPKARTGKAGAATAGKKGKLTREDLEGAKTGVKAFAPWDATFKGVTDKIGPPTKIEGTMNLWYAKDGDKCLELLMDKMNDSVGKTGISEYTKEMATQYAKCDAK